MLSLTAATLVGVAAILPARAAEEAAECRTFATEMISRSAGIPRVTAITCTFSRAALTYTCVTQAGTQRSTSTTAYTTLADFVRETAVVPPLTKAYSTSFATSDGRTGSGNLEHDAQGRLVRQTTTLSNGVVQTDSFSEWDPAGRPTKMAWKGGVEGGAFDLVYDDFAMTTRFVPLTEGGRACELTYNAHGEMTSNVCRAGESSASSSWTLLKTARVCR